MGYGSGVAVSCGIGCRRGSDPTLLWLWCRMATEALIQPSLGTSICQKRKKEKQTNKNTNIGLGEGELDEGSQKVQNSSYK